MKEKNSSMAIHSKYIFLFILLANFQVSFTQEHEYLANDQSAKWINLLYDESEEIDDAEIIQSYEAYYKTHPFVKNKDTQNYKRWLKSLTYQLPNNPDNDQKYKEKRRFQNAQRAGLSWTSIGPYDWDHDAANRSYAPGAAHVYTIEQAPSNPNILYAGTATAGIWKTSNHGLQWILISGSYLSNHCSSIAINNNNPAVIYVELEGSIYKSINGGNTFSPTGNASFQSINMDVKEIRVYPNNNNHLLLASSTGLYRSLDGGTNWTSIYSGEFQEIEFHPIIPSIIYVIKKNGNTTEFYRSTDGGATFTIQLNGWPSPITVDSEVQQRTEIAVSLAMPDKVFAHATGSANGGSGLYGVYVSDNQGQNWTFQCCGPQPAGPPSASNMNLMGWSDEGLDDGGQYNYDVAFDVSPTNGDSILLGGVNLWVSGDQGNNFICPAKWSHSDKPNYVHADIHDIKHFQNSNEIWIAGDGGIFFSNDNGATYERRIFGISGTDFWGYEQGFWFGDVMLGGAYHNGTMLREENTYLNDWVCTDGGDGVRGFVHPTLDRQVFSDYNIKQLSGDRTVAPQTRSFQYKPNATYTTGISSEILFHPNYQNTYYSGFEDQLIMTSDNGFTFEVIHDFNENLAAMAISDSDPEVIYVTTFPDWWGDKHIYRTIDAGQNWTDITPTVPNRKWIPYDIEIDPQDPMHIWIARTNMYSTPEIDGFSIFESNNGGNVWNNISGTGLNGESPTNIVLQKGSNNALYVGTRRAVYYRDDNSTDWTLYTNGLPASTFSLKLRPYYRKQVIRNATNRSVYEIDFKNQNTRVIANFVVDKANVNCTNDQVQFTDRSIVSDQNVEWLWTFEGGNPAISTERAPLVSYDCQGSYDVTLTVTDINGTDTKTGNNFIEVLDDCQPSADQNKSLNCLSTNGHMIASGFSEKTNSFTVTAWIKPSSIQDEYSAILMNDGDSGGLNFREANNTLAYHWPGGQWWWDSNLEVVPNEWSYVAMVVSPGGVTLYLNEQEASHSFEAGQVLFDQIRIGSYKGWGSRNFDGLIDEVCMWNRALTRDEIRLKRHLRKNTLEEEGLMAYYSFERNGNIAFDQTQLHPGNLNGPANRMLSDLPVGSGISEQQNVNAGTQNLNFNLPEVSLAFNANTNNPDGNLVVTRLNEFPMTLTESKLIDQSYYIINNYGNNTSFDNLNSIKFNSAGVISTTMEQYNDFFKLESRGSNEGNTNWSPLLNTDVSSTTGNKGSINFNDASIINSFGQYIITRKEFPADSAEVSIIQSNNSQQLRIGGGSIQLALQSSTQGIKLPIISDIDLANAGNPSEGLMAYHQESKEVIFFNGIQWQVVISSSIELNGSFDNNLNITGTSLGEAQLDQSAILNLKPSSGFIKLNQGQIENIQTPEVGMLIYNSVTRELQVHNANAWQSLLSKNTSLIVSSSGNGISPTKGLVIGSEIKDPNAILELSADNKSLGLPLANVYQVAEPVEGLLIYDLGIKELLLFNGTEWRALVIN